ncbi:hypothetical protein RB195_025894 [Necator americanus]|uniref:Serpentine receptor class gamma n=1 Tax=Necator americanus TaxID=51031 RepID=A0ABR1EUG2_NECAM
MLVQLQRPITTLAWVMLLYPLVFAISVQGLLILFTYNVQEILFFGITIRFIPEKNASYSPRHPSVAIKTNLLVYFPFLDEIALVCYRSKFGFDDEVLGHVQKTNEINCTSIISIPQRIG